MKQNLIQFSALLIVLLVGTANAIGDKGSADVLLVSGTGSNVTSSNVTITYNETGPFKGGDVVKITAAFDKTVELADLTVELGGIPLNVDVMDNVSGTVWSYDYEIPGGDTNGAVNVTVSGINTLPGDLIMKTDPNAFVIDNEAPSFDGIQPAKYVNTECVVFEFNASDNLDDKIAYTIYINGTENKTGTISSNGNVRYEIEKPDGYYQWEVKLEDDAGNIGGSGLKDLYVDTKDPYITVVSPVEGFVSAADPLRFNFTARDTLSENYNLNMYYQLYIDGVPDMSNSDNMVSGKYVNISKSGLEDGAHNWSVFVEDKAENNCTSKARNFYVNNLGLVVELISPNSFGGFVPADQTFNFSVSGGPGLPFDYELLINGTKVKNGTSVIGEGGVSYCSVNATVADGVNIPWTVKVTDNAGRTSEPEPFYISVDTTAPAPVAKLIVTDALSDTTWYYTYDEPGLRVCWDKNTEPDLAGYMVYISDSEPSSIEDMEPAVPVSQVFDNDTFMSMYIGTYGGKPLVYGKDYWVVVASLDIAGNGGVNICGPVQTYEDMNVTLDAGWNLKSVPKRLATFNADTCSAFGDNSTVIYWNGNSWEFPKTIEPCKGYWVYSPEAYKNNVKFKPMPVSSTSPDVPASLDLASGWQMIGHTSTVPVEWSTTLSSLKDALNGYKYSNLITYSQNEGWGGIIPDTDYYIILVGENGTSFNGTGPASLLQTDGYMTPGQGYWIFMTGDGTYASIENVDVYAA